ncbi:hypothetical protein [Sphingomonas sp. DC1100-1]|uniref:hypothetical protein n=1 Tax=unclassified Sphingomonas TaxID=196159 RepID=UPI003CEAA43E
MRILVSDALFAEAAQWPDLEGLLDRARLNRCYLDARNPNSATTNPWLDQVDQRRRQEWLNASSWATRDGAIYRLRTFIADVESNPDAKPLPKITLREGIELADRPVTLWVENGRNDRKFFLALMPAEQRAMFQELERRHIFKVDSRGGLGELRVSLAELHERGSLDSRSNRALFDSDAEVPGHRSRDALSMIAFCESAGLAYHCLVRRAIENYIPRKALWNWTTLHGPKRRVERSSKVDAYDRMNSDQRRHFRMKDGWDANPSHQVAALFQDVSDVDRQTLRGGIDGDIASVYDSFMGAIYDWASKEGIDPEVQATINEIADWIRVPYA